MLLQGPAVFRRSHTPRKFPRGLTLVSATYTSAGTYLRLTFDRPVNVAAIDVTAIVVEAQPNFTILRGTGTATLVTPQQVNVPMAAFAMTSGSQVLLTAAANTRIVAGDGGAWAGVTALALPFG